MDSNQHAPRTRGLRASGPINGVKPGTGPSRSVKRFEIYNLPSFSSELGAALLSGELDYARLLDPVTGRKVDYTPWMTATDGYQSAVYTVWVISERKPLNDLRVRRAMQWACGRHIPVAVIVGVDRVVFGTDRPYDDMVFDRPVSWILSLESLTQDENH